MNFLEFLFPFNSFDQPAYFSSWENLQKLTESSLPGPEVSNEMHDGRTVLRSTFPGLWTNVTGMSGPGPRLVEEVRHVLLSLTWDIDSVLVSFTGDINHVSSDSLDLKHLTRTDQPLVRPQLTEPRSQQNWRLSPSTWLWGTRRITSCRLSRNDLIMTATCQSRPITMRMELCSVRGESLERVNLWVSYHYSC